MGYPFRQWPETEDKAGISGVPTPQWTGFITSMRNTYAAPAGF